MLTPVQVDVKTMSTLPEKPKQRKLFPILVIIILILILLLFDWQSLPLFGGKNLTILHTNNFYSQMGPLEEEHNGQTVLTGGFDRIAAKVKEIKKANKNVLLLDGGDTTKGTLFTRLYGSIPIGALMGKLGYDAIVIGDDDFYDGPEGLAKYIKSTSIPFLGANLDATHSKELNGAFKPYIIINIDSLKIGILGLITTDANLYAKSGNDVEILDPIEYAKKYVKELKPKVDIIIALTHLGLKVDRELAAKVSDIDIIIGGHSETKLTVPVLVKNPKGRNVIIVQAKSQGRFLGRLDVAAGPGKVDLIRYELIPIDSSIKPDPDFEGIIKDLYDKLHIEVNKTIGESKVDLDSRINHLRTRETNVGDLFTESVKEAFPEVEIVLQNSGGIREDEIVPAGKLTLGDIWHWHPFQNKIVLLTLNGKQVKEVLERGASNLPVGMGNFLQVAGITYTIDITGIPQELTADNKKIKVAGERIMDVKVNGKPLNFEKEYRVAIPDFLAPGGDGFITFHYGKDIVYTNVFLTDLIKLYIEKHSPLNLKTDGRIQVKGGLIH